MMANKSGALSPEDQVKVLALIWGMDEEEDGYVFLPWIPGWTNSKLERLQNWKEGPAFHWPNDRDKILKHVQEHQNDDLYFSVNKFLSESRGKGNVGESFVLYADLDEVHPRTDIEKRMKPSIAWETSPGRYQAVWLMRGMAWGACEPGGLNQRLTRYTGADKSGYDSTQVLRIPGKGTNWKWNYKDEDGRPAPGQLLWYGNKEYSWDFFEFLPEVKTYGDEIDIEDADVEAIDRHAVWSRVRLKCSSTVRSYMAMKSREAEGSDHDRSEVLWQIERDLADAGCSVAEIVAIVRHTPWNKYEGRNSELSQLQNEAAKAIGVREEEAEEDTLETFNATRPNILPTLSSLTDVSIPRPNWLVRKIWTKGSCGFISGAPKSYKSYMALDMAISIATGTPFLNDPQFSTGSNKKVIYLQEEDSLPLVLHRAEQILELKASERHWHGQLSFDNTTHDDASGSRPGTLSELVWTPPVRLDSLAMLVRAGFVASDPAWLGWLADMVVEFKADMVIIDTLGTTLGDVELNDSSRTNDRILRPLKTIAEQGNCAIAVVHHNKKSNDDKTRSGQQMLGSVALHAWVESAIYVQSKEKLTNSPHSEVKVERENKLAEDMKFRVRIPTMFTETGAADQGARQLWEPEVIVGWAETSEGEAEPEANKNDRKRTAGEKIVSVMAEMGGKSNMLPVDRIVEVYGQQRHSVIRQLNGAASRGLIEGSHEDGWTIV